MKELDGETNWSKNFINTNPTRKDTNYTWYSKNFDKINVYLSMKGIIGTQRYSRGYFYESDIDDIFEVLNGKHDRIA